MTWTPILAFAVVALVFALGDIVSSKTKGIITSLLFAVFAFLIFGGTLHILPGDMVDTSGLSTIIPTFGMAVILTNVGTLLDLNQLRKEWKTLVVAAGACFAIAVICATVGVLLFGHERAFAAMAPISGGTVSTLMVLEVANEAGRTDLARFISTVQVMQVLIGLPAASICLHKEAKRYMDSGDYKLSLAPAGKEINLKFIKMPNALDTATGHFARIGITAVFGLLLSNLTGIPVTITYLVVGCIAGAIGFVEKDALSKSGGGGIVLLATYATVLSGFLTMNLAEFGALLIPVFGLLIISSVGILIISFVLGKIFKWSPWLTSAVGFTCMFGYPTTYALAVEVGNGITVDRDDLSTEEKARIVDYLMPKMIVGGVGTVSIGSVVLATIIAPMILH